MGDQRTSNPGVHVRFLLLALPFVMACVDADAPVNPDDSTPFVLEVPKGSTASGLTSTLASEGLIPGEFQYKLFLRGTDASCLKAGRFEVRRSMSLNELLATLCGPPLPDDVPFTVVEGWRIRDIDAALVDKGWIEAGAFTRLATDKAVDGGFPVPSPTLEGYLYPETYRLTPGDDLARQLISRQLATFKERFLDQHSDFGKRDLHQIVVMASMLEREEPKPKNRPLVAGILWKRIDGDFALGVDATSRYELENWNDRKEFLKKLKDPDDDYNTRLHKGLPPTAIGNPTLASLEAAMNPEDSPYWYYLHDASGEIHPGRNAEEHEANRKKYNVY